jgi:hypothetical protein
VFVHLLLITFKLKADVAILEPTTLLKNGRVTNCRILQPLLKFLSNMAVTSQTLKYFLSTVYEHVYKLQDFLGDDVCKHSLPFQRFGNALKTRVKIKLSLYLNSSVQCHEGIWGSGGTAPLFLTSELDGSGQIHAFAALARRKEPPVPIKYEAR